VTAVLTRLEGQVSSDYIVDDGVMRIALIYVPAAQRRQGLGTAELRRLIQLADDRGWSIELTADSVFGMPLPELAAWYTRHGFTVTADLGRERARMVRPAA
jgi:GNAT superfamily N-acetyltransferase